MGKITMPRFKRSVYDEDARKSCVEVVDKKGRIFSGTAMVSPEDIAAGLESRFVGCQVAEIRAYQKALRREKQDIRVERDTLKSFRSTVSQTRNAEFYSYIIKLLDNRIKNCDERLEAADKIMHRLDGQAISAVDYNLAKAELIKKHLENLNAMANDKITGAE